MLRKWFFSTHEIKIKLKGYYFLIFVVLILLAGVVSHITVKGDIVVPRVVGMNLSEAKDKLDSVGLGYSIIEDFSEIMENEIILAQTPNYDSVIKKGVNVTIIVNQKGE